MQEAGEEIGTIITGIAHISRHLKAIDEAAREEAGALQDVNGAVATIDQGTRQNAQMAEQTYTASSGMVHKAGQLRDLLNGFHLKASG
jgi:methyl-accepting chemotaxis protein